MYLHSSLQLRGKDFEPSEVTAVMGLAPKYAWKAGDTWFKNFASGKVEDKRYQSYWCFNIYSGEQTDEEQAFKKMLDFLKQNEQALAKVLRMNLDNEFYLGITSSENVAINPNNELLAIVAKLGLKFYIKFTIDSNEPTSPP